MYEKEGNNGSYIFRLFGDTYIDATRIGGKARFINHSCDPNCETKIMDLFGEKHVVIVALRDIEPYEELVYDYKIEFESKDKRIKCCCGSAKCKGWLNWNEQAELLDTTTNQHKRKIPFSGLYLNDKLGNKIRIVKQKEKEDETKVVQLPDTVDKSIIETLSSLNIKVSINNQN